jgi:ribonuclease BN (tRNA processing enzyme)
MRFTFLGSGDAFGTGGRFNTCFHVASGDDAFLIDCGATSLVAMRRFNVDPASIGTIFLSHLHGDHFGGLPFFLLDAQLISRRAAPLVIAGPPGAEARLNAAMEVLFPGSSKVKQRFAITFVEIAPGDERQVGAVTVRPFLAAHNSGAPSLTLRLSCEGKVIVYSGDTEWCDSLVQAADGADLLVVEASSYDKPIPQHLDYATIRARRGELKARRIVLTHMGPAMLARSGEVEFETAADGKTIEL